MTQPRIRLGDLLVESRIISREQLEEVLEHQRKDGRRLGTLLVEAGLVTETQVTQILSQQLSVPWVSLHHIEFSRQLLNHVPRDVAERYCLVPIFVRRVRGLGQTLYVAMDDPSDENAQRAVTEHSGLPVRAMIAPPTDIKSAIRVYYGGRTGTASLSDAEGDAGESAEQAPTEAEPPAEQAPPPADQAPPPAPRAREPSSFDIDVDQEMRAAPAPADDSPALAERAPPPAEEPTPAVPGEPAEDAKPDAAPSSPPASVPAPAPISQRPTPIGPAPDFLKRLTPPPVSGPEIEAHEVALPRPKGKAPRMITLTLLDGTTVNLPARGSKKSEAPPAAEEPPPESDQLTARDLVAALRAVSHGADASEILGGDVSWEKMFAALLALLLKKHLIADWEFVEEYKKV